MTPSHTPHPAPSSARTIDVENEDAPRGCGWFDSSHALQCGLLVTEHTSPGAALAAMPLAGWLALQLGTWQPAGALC